ncbi:hypothetical protein PG994_004509 [Apiospora phragmitis]|uniref:Zn(2)-C6 fungal-type domain-containing protein n=1 Tax=Apiospora phragmitis TaxID=2905665 RepID=A0ABR1VTV6_9PEZI
MASFTALNGGDQKPMDRGSGSPTNRRPDSEERPEVAVPGPTARPSSRDISSNPRDRWPSSGPERSSYAYPDVEGPHKRKRSNSLELRREAPSAPEDRTHAPPSQPEPRDVYGTSQHHERDYRPYGDENRGERSDPWYSQHSRDERSAYETQNSAVSIASQSEGQGEDSLRRSQMDSQQGYSPTSPDDESSYYGGSYTPEHRRDGTVIQSDPKKRKRNFSNRTKTGCLTCRRRKKKCDETKPECNNCMRGGFICQGYANQRGYQKMENKPPAVPLESKDPSYVPPGAYGMPQQAPYPSQSAPLAAPPKREAPPPYRGHSLRIEPPQGRPVMTDDERTASTIPTASTATPDNKLSIPSAYTAQQGNPFPTPISAISSAANFESRVLSKEYHQRIPPLHDASRTEPETPQSGIPNTTLPQLNMLNAPTRTDSPSSHHQQPPPPPPPASTTSAQVAAQLALSHSHFPPPPRQATQKELMLRNDWYQPFNKELVLERERCSAACWRFNNSTNPNNGVSGNERSRLFREILMPTEPINLSPTQQSPVSNSGRVRDNVDNAVIGDNVVIEAPFTCDYGYNITIGQNVFIGRNCTIIDPCSVKIGNNTYIGPNVSLFAATLDTNPAKRMGSKSLQKGEPITIEEDVWIGGNVIVLPGLKIGKGSTVGAGSVVTRDVPNFTIVTGNPAHVLRGIRP